MVRQVKTKTHKELINHPDHYNSHPSGVECIEIIRSFDFNLGNAFKYLFRKDEKDNTIQDMKKALWYIRDELKKRSKYKNNLFYSLQRMLRIPNLYKYFAYKERYEKIIAVAEAEVLKNNKLPIIYYCLNDADYHPFDIEHLESIEVYIKNMIEREAENKNY